MTKLSIRALSAGMAAALIAAPLALAQQAPSHDSAHDQSSHPAASHATVSHSAPARPAASHVATSHTAMSAPSHMAQPAPHMASAPAHTAPPPQRASYSSGHQWHQGDHYDGSRNVVSNWNTYHLRQPPQGYEWVQDGSQFVLVAVASGVIADVIVNALNQ